jgi:uncharacterized protein with PIN domain
MKRPEREPGQARADDPGGSGLPNLPDVRFIVDVNVGKLAKWLRIMGFDTLFINPIDDGELVEIARLEGRIVLTKDTHIADRRLVTSGQVRVVEVEGDQLLEQLRFVTSTLGLRGPFNLLSRCIEDNSPLVPVEKSRVRARVPPYVYSTQERFVTCPRCSRVYWAGTHWQRMRELVDDLSRA